MSVIEEFRKYQSVPQIKQLIDRLQSLQYDLGQQIKVDFEKAYSIKGAPVSYVHVGLKHIIRKVLQRAVESTN